ncbi:MAG: DUF4405 domain-containing protein [Gemmatimonadaceae bacterium]
MLIAFAALESPGNASSYRLHEWIGLAFIPMFALHIVFSWSWIIGAWRRVRERTEQRARLNFLLNGALCVMMVVIIVSGLVISDYVLPAAGIRTVGTQRWQQLHNFTSSLILPVVGLHAGLNWIWIRGAFRRYVVSPFKRHARAQRRTYDGA